MHLIIALMAQSDTLTFPR